MELVLFSIQIFLTGFLNVQLDLDIVNLSNLMFDFRIASDSVFKIVL